MQNIELKLDQVFSSLSNQFDIVPLDVADCPVFLAVSLPSNDSNTGLLPRLPSGKGLSLQQALMSAAGEAVELRASLAQNLERKRFVFENRDGIDFVFAKNLHDNCGEFFPAQSVFLDYAFVYKEQLLFEADSNGCAAGLTYDGALSAALLECIERDALAIWWYGKQSRGHLPLSILDSVEPRLSWWLGTRHRLTMLIDVRSDVGIPVVVAASSEADGTLVAMGSAAATNIHAAAVSAVTEMVQMEVSIHTGKLQDNSSLTMWLAHATARGMQQFMPSETVATFSGGDDLNIFDLMRNLNFRVFAINLTQSSDVLHTVRVIVPDFCAMGRKFSAKRILHSNGLNPHYNGALSVSDFETLEPY